MYPNFLYQYALELQREREKELLNLAEDERLVRKARLVTNSNSAKLPIVNLYELMRALARNILRPIKVATVTCDAEPSSCASCGSLQGQVC